MEAKELAESMIQDPSRRTMAEIEFVAKAFLDQQATITRLTAECANICERQEQEDCAGEFNIYKECANAIRAHFKALSEDTSDKEKGND